VQVEGTPGADQLERLRRGVALGDFISSPCGARSIDEPPGLWPRTPPIRARRAIPTAWLELSLHEGRYRQVRWIAAAVGLPTLRLVRWGRPVDARGLLPGAVGPAAARRVVSSRPIA
jgi:23S rRNA pseudouridine2457 synthase